jgi:hypothetical protein
VRSELTRLSNLLPPPRSAEEALARFRETVEARNLTGTVEYSSAPQPAPRPIYQRTNLAGRFGKAMPWWACVLRNKARPFTALSVAIAISSHVNQRSGEAWASQETIARGLGISPKAVSRAVRTLVEVGVLTVRRRRRDTNVYRVNLGSAAARESKVMLDSPDTGLDSPTVVAPDSPPVVPQT